VIARSILPTEPSALVEYFQGMRGSIRVVFEEGTQAQRLHDRWLRPSMTSSCAIGAERRVATRRTSGMPVGNGLTLQRQAARPGRRVQTYPLTRVSLTGSVRTRRDTQKPRMGRVSRPTASCNMKNPTAITEW
jgi:hypothetical protein